MYIKRDYNNTFTHKVNKIIGGLANRLQRDYILRKLTLTSLKEAEVKARENLDKDLYDVLEWPTTIEEYLSFLNKFCKTTPCQTGLPGWKKPGGANESYQEVYDRLCHFHFLIGNGKKSLQMDPWFSKWLVKFASLWGEFLNTTESFSPKTLESFIKYSPEYGVMDSMIETSEDQKYYSDVIKWDNKYWRSNSPSGWLTWNQFFARKLNPGKRKICEPGNNKVITSPADCTYKEHFHINENSEVGKVIMKKSHSYGSIKDLLGDKAAEYHDTFAGGKFIHCFLGPYSYHRFHAPVSGVVEKCYSIAGKAYLHTDIKDGQFDAPDSAKDGYEFSQQRGVIIINTRDVGKVAIIPVGMSQVSSVNMIATEGSSLLKGDEFGYFMFGASDIIMLFEKKVDVTFTRTDDKYIHFGDKVATIK